MDGAREYNAKGNKSEKDKYHRISFMWNLRKKNQLNIGEGKEK